MTNTADVESCEKCGEKNATTEKSCTMCGSLLPWFQRDATSSMSAAPSSPQTNLRQSSLSSDLQAFGQPAGPPATQASPKSSSNQSVDEEKRTPFDIVLQVGGGVICVAGAFFWCGNVLHFYPTFPGVGYITMVVGYVLWRIGD